MHTKRVLVCGQRFGLWVIEAEVEPRRGHRMFRARCDCGTVRVMLIGTLVTGATVSCGCRRGTHRQSGRRTLTYVSWSQMRQRCTNRRHHAWADYGGRGISVCPRWQRFEHFLADMGARPSVLHSLDRINNAGSYTPNNCRWATPSEQSANRRSPVTPFHVRHRANVAVYNALQKGTLVRPEACEECGDGSTVPDAHHEDYTVPLAVRWLCPPCHIRADVARRAQCNHTWELPPA